MKTYLQIKNKNLFLVLVTILLLFIFKLLVVNDSFLIITTILFESSIFFLLLIFAGNFNNSKEKLVKSYIFNIFFFVHLTFSFLYSYFLDDVVNMKLTLIGMEWGAIVFFFKNLFPFNLTIFYLCILVTIFFFLIFYKGRKVRLTKKKTIFCIVICLLVLITVPLVSFNHFSSPYVNTLSDFKHVLFGTKITLQSVNATEEDFNFLQKNNFEYSRQLDYEKILIFVMEGVSYENFLEAVENIPEEENFFHLVKENSHYYSNYYSNNQDSRTAVMAMLSSFFVPFEAYTPNNWQELYANKVIQESSLVEYFNINGYSTAFMISSVETPVVSRVYPWSEIHHLEDYDKYYDEGKYICLHVLEYQHGCEDEILLEELEQVVLENNRLFLFQEMVYGHGHKYLVLKRKSPTEYYNDYFLKVYNHLLDNNLWDDTLMVIVSDHGPKSFRNMIKEEGYKVPMIIISKEFSYEIDENLYSHLDFKDLLFGQQKASELVYLIGSTKSSLEGYVISSGEYAIVQNNVVLGRSWSYDREQTENYLGLLGDYQDSFTLDLDI